jgi:divalent metal cation (Fe/Co/Zn/Cd) transporter
MDLLAAALALFAVRHAGRPADEEHPYGHGKVENISGTVEALLILGRASGSWWRPSTGCATRGPWTTPPGAWR